MLSMGEKTYSVPVSMFRDNRNRVCDALKQKGETVVENAVILLKGGEALPHYNTDVDYLFVQVSFFKRSIKKNLTILSMLFESFNLTTRKLYLLP